MNAERRLPQWYLAKVNAAADVFADAPDGVSLRMPYVNGEMGGKGVSMQRRGVMANQQPPSAGTSQRRQRTATAPGRDGWRSDVPENADGERQ